MNTNIFFPDVPTRTYKIFHDVDVLDAKPIEQHPYRSIPVKQHILKGRNPIACVKTNAK